jgi:hypothetical protein
MRNFLKHGLAFLVACCSIGFAAGARAQAAPHFDATTGADEALLRRAGENELNATQACHPLVLARMELPWPERDPSMRAFSALAGHAATHGPGVAHPAAYASAGAMTCVVQEDDTVHAKDAGPDTGSLAKGMTRYEPGSTWHPDE